ncbi:unnamed protein product [Vitrella brassicaformis CCMP3155]|uniref:FYVE-type domain-containing protein n=3 Tax=Vitrella brassicaformis TaxID=1169539 RepID=A0A0G4FCM9_VITBC|nr:unnamed protein product [Vitrella brassicaformis CCMP3155]|eukprot:CEM10580.1 unnamed protein product [Vitrella brassicaformis CCMP3155]
MQSRKKTSKKRLPTLPRCPSSPTQSSSQLPLPSQTSVSSKRGQRVTVSLRRPLAEGEQTTSIPLPRKTSDAIQLLDSHSEDSPTSLAARFKKAAHDEREPAAEESPLGAGADAARSVVVGIVPPLDAVLHRPVHPEGLQKSESIGNLSVCSGRSRFERPDDKMTRSFTAQSSIDELFEAADRHLVLNQRPSAFGAYSLHQLEAICTSVDTKVRDAVEKKKTDPDTHSPYLRRLNTEPSKAIEVTGESRSLSPQYDETSAMEEQPPHIGPPVPLPIDHTEDLGDDSMDEDYWADHDHEDVCEGCQAFIGEMQAIQEQIEEKESLADEESRSLIEELQERVAARTAHEVTCHDLRTHQLELRMQKEQHILNELVAELRTRQKRVDRLSRQLIQNHKSTTVLHRYIANLPPSLSPSALSHPIGITPASTSPSAHSSRSAVKTMSRRRSVPTLRLPFADFQSADAATATDPEVNRQGKDAATVAERFRLLFAASVEEDNTDLPTARRISRDQQEDGGRQDSGITDQFEMVGMSERSSQVTDSFLLRQEAVHVSMGGAPQSSSSIRTWTGFFSSASKGAVGRFPLVAPPWHLADHCERCGKNFTMLFRRHHCRHCGFSVCGGCGCYSLPVPKFGYLRAVRVCVVCFESFQQNWRVTPLLRPVPSLTTSTHTDVPALSVSGAQPQHSLTDRHWGRRALKEDVDSVTGSQGKAFGHGHGGVLTKDVAA